MGRVRLTTVRDTSLVLSCCAGAVERGLSLGSRQTATTVVVRGWPSERGGTHAGATLSEATLSEATWLQVTVGVAGSSAGGVADSAGGTDGACVDGIGGEGGRADGAEVCRAGLSVRNAELTAGATEAPW